MNKGVLTNGKKLDFDKKQKKQKHIYDTEQVSFERIRENV